MAVKIKWNRPAFQEIRRSAPVTAELNKLVDDVLGRLSTPGYAGGVERGKSRSRGYVVTYDFEAILDNAENHSLIRAASGP